MPLLLAMLCAPQRYPAAALVLMAIGELVRLWAVGHIGLPSRTRADGAHRVVQGGPYGLVRNPLYIGNILIFVGLGVLAWPWALISGPALALHYHFIVGWEESNLTQKLGAPYTDYCARVGRWVPRAAVLPSGAWNGREALRSERSTLLVLALILLFAGGRGLLP